MLSSAKIRFACALLLVAFITTFGLVNAPAQSGWKQIIVRCSPEDLDKIRAKIAAAIVDSYRGHYLLNVAASTNNDDIEGIQRNSITAVDNKVVQIGRRHSRNNNNNNGNNGSRRSSGIRTQVVNYYGTSAPELYTQQPAAGKISLPQALSVATGSGARVAVIDTGIDFDHPTLKGVILPGKNYVGRTPVPSEYDDPAVMQAGAEPLELLQAGAEPLELLQAGAEPLELMRKANAVSGVMNVAPLFGHGTMTAGLVHLVAPHAGIIPLKAFDATGTASEWNVIRAVYDAVSMGADVINMSFASSQRSKLIDAALDDAASHGVVLTGAAGNDNTQSPAYPAAEDEVVAVTALDINDNKASFANFGKYVDLSAPGVDLITTFPSSMFAIASGTSESTPLVSGVFALVKQNGTRGLNPRQVVERAVDVINEPPQYRDKLGKGRINASKALY